MRIIGIIHSVDVDNRIISIKKTKKLVFLYFQASLMNLLKRYLYNGNIIDLEYSNETIIKNKVLAYRVNFIYTLCSKNKYQKVLYYDKKTLDKGLKETLNKLDNLMFVDFEMTMPSYSFKGSYISEIIQAGIVLTDKCFNTIDTLTMKVEPVINKELSNRTLKFLNLDREEFKKEARPFEEFYQVFKALLLKYNPTIMVYGKNDILSLERSYIINGVESLKDISRFMNLNKIIRNYYDLRNDPGLFKLYQIYSKNDMFQAHDALADSIVTKEVYKYFLDDVNHQNFQRDEFRRLLD